MSLSTTRGRPAHPLPSNPKDVVRVLRHRQTALDYYYNMSDIDAWSRACVNNSRKRAKRLNIAHNLTPEQVQDLFPRDGLCPILGIPLTIEKGHRYARENSATVDRINPFGGYEIGNVHVISNLANKGKSHMNLGQLIQLGQWAATIIERIG